MINQKRVGETQNKSRQSDFVIYHFNEFESISWRGEDQTIKESGSTEVNNGHLSIVCVNWSGEDTINKNR